MKLFNYIDKLLMGFKAYFEMDKKSNKSISHN